MSCRGSSIIQLLFPLFAASPRRIFCHAERSKASASSTKNAARGFALLSGLCEQQNIFQRRREEFFIIVIGSLQ
jgi:hypothetical protein